MAKAILKYRPQSVAEYAAVPDIFITQESVKAVNKWAAAVQERYEGGKRMFLLASAKILLTAIKGKAPTIAGVGKYADSLEVVVVDGLRAEEAVAIIYKYKQRRRIKKDMNGRRMALLIKPREGAPKWVSVLARYQPWPAYMVPVVPDSKDAQVIARQVTETEEQDLRDRLLTNRRKIEFELRDNGCDKPVRTDTKFNDAIEVVDDVAFEVLRSEFGYGAGKQVSHWRPAMADYSQELYRLQNAFVQYIMTGRRSGFDMPDYTVLQATELQNYDKSLQDKLAPLAKLG